MLRNFLLSVSEKAIIEAASSKILNLEENKREKIAEELELPSIVKEYLIEVSPDQFLDDMKTVSNYCSQGSNKTVDIKKCLLFKKVRYFLINTLALKIDHLDSSFYLFKKDDKHKVLDKLISSDSKVAKTLKSFLANYNYEQIVDEILKFSSKISNTPYLIIQTPREIDLELKREIRLSLQKNHKNAFPIFQVNPNLIGGLRLFIDGKTTDYSWRSRVHQLINITRA